MANVARCKEHQVVYWLISTPSKLKLLHI